MAAKITSLSLYILNKDEFFSKIVIFVENCFISKQEIEAF